MKITNETCNSFFSLLLIDVMRTNKKKLNCKSMPIFRLCVKSHIYHIKCVNVNKILELIFFLYLIWFRLDINYELKCFFFFQRITFISKSFTLIFFTSFSFSQFAFLCSSFWCHFPFKPLLIDVKMWSSQKDYILLYSKKYYEVKPIKKRERLKIVLDYVMAIRAFLLVDKYLKFQRRKKNAL